MDRHESAVIMDGSGRDWNRNQRCFNYINMGDPEPEYDTVDDQEEVHRHVHILPAQPLHEEREYADRDLPRSSSAQSLSSLSSGLSNSLLREFPPSPTSGPAVNRDLKPGRKKTRIGRSLPPALPGEKHSPRFPSSPHPFTSELVNRLSALNLPEAPRTEGHRGTKRAEFSPLKNGSRRAELVPVSHSNQRHSLDLDSQEIDKRSEHTFEREPSFRHHHEWPQTKEDFEQNVFVPMEKPQQTYCEEDWYVGPCNRANAEHALHLVNRDGAFLVRDCSINTNSEPLVLSVYHDKKVYNVKIRFIESNSKYALGTGQRSNDLFNSVADIIKFHSIFPIILISGRNLPGCRYPENCVLTCPVTRWDVNQLLQ